MFIYINNIHLSSKILMLSQRGLSPFYFLYLIL